MRKSIQLTRVFSLTCLLSGSTYGQCSFDWKPGDQLPGLSGAVLATQTWDPDGPGPQQEVLVVAGNTFMGPNIAANKVAMWDGSQWHPLDNGINGLGFVSALAVYNGELIAGGTIIITDNADPKNPVAENIVRWDGSAWQPFSLPLGSGGPDGSVKALTVFNGELIVGGLFNSVAGNPASRIARWNGSSWHDLNGGVNGFVNDVEVVGGELVVCGTFTSAGGVAANRIAKWNGTAWSALGTGMNNTVESLSSLNGDLIAGGDFTNAGGISAKRIARWNGAAWQALGSGMNDLVRELLPYKGELIAAGSFTTAGGAQAQRIAKWDGANWIPLGQGIEDSDSTSMPSVRALAEFSGELIVGGHFITAGGNGVANIARWDGDTWHSYNTGANGTVHALLHFDNALIAGGSFTSIGGSNIQHVARWDGTSWSAFGAPTDQLNGPVYAWAEFQGQLIVGGEFIMGDEGELSHIARWNGTSWQPLELGTSGPVHTMIVHDGDLIVGGSFDVAYTITVNNIARWDGAAWHAMGNGLTGNFDHTGPTAVLSLLVHEGTLFAGGDFTDSGTQAVNAIATWNGTTWQQVGPGLNNFVSAVAFYNGELIVGGEFIYPSGPNAIRRIARWDGVAWQKLGNGMESPSNTSVNALTIFDGELIAVGRFDSAGLQPAVNIARWNGSEWHTLGQGLQNCVCPYYETVVRAVLPFNGELITGGQFLKAGASESAFWARWAPSLKCAGDVAPSCGDGNVNVDDLLNIINTWGPCEDIHDCGADIAPINGGDQQVDVDDLLIIINSWGPC